MHSDADAELRRTLAAHARSFYLNDWMVGTSGNVSARQGDSSFWITASGRSKGELAESDFLEVGLDGGVLHRFAPSDKPSAETVIHRALYSIVPETRAIYHVHSVEGNLVSGWAEGGSLVLPPLEMIKGFDIWEQDPLVPIPVLRNHLEVPRIAEEIRNLFTVGPPRIPVLVIENHGVTVWARNPTAARNYIELIEYIFRYMAMRGRL